MFKSFLTVLKRDLMLALRRKSDVFTVLFFFIIVISIFPLGVGFEAGTLRKIVPGVVWVAALLASTLALERIFANDYDDGTLEQMLMTPQPLSILVFAKIIAHWLLTGLPLVLIAPLAGLQYNLSLPTIGTLMLVLLIGTPVLSMIGAIGAALTLGLRGGGVLISLLVLPLYIPVLVYGAGALSASMQGDVSLDAYYLLLSAFLLLALVFAPWATAAALRISVE